MNTPSTQSLTSRLATHLAAPARTSPGAAAAGDVLDPAVHALSLDAVVNRWTEDDPRWDRLPRRRLTPTSANPSTKEH